MTKPILLKARKRPRLGDVVEIPVPRKGYAYAQYINYHREPPGYGEMLRVLPGMFKKRPETVMSLVDEKELYFFFFPLGVACHRGYTTIIGNAPIPKRLETWPTLRACNENFETGEKTWYLWDGKKSRCIGSLRPEHHDLSLKETWNLTELERRLAKGWMPRDEI